MEKVQRWIYKIERDVETSDSTLTSYLQQGARETRGTEKQAGAAAVFDLFRGMNGLEGRQPLENRSSALNCELKIARRQYGFGFSPSCGATNRRQLVIEKLRGLVNGKCGSYSFFYSFIYRKLSTPEI